IEHGRTGMLARSGAPSDLADALEPLLLDAGLRETIARAGRERFLAEFTDAALRRRFFASLQALLAGSGAPRPGDAASGAPAPPTPSSPAPGA
ncbi:MAG TPA: glycosyltransferase, partial [Solirubrobacteraceae bacterium]